MGLDIQRDLSSLLQHLKRQFWLLQTSRLYVTIAIMSTSPKMPLSRSEYWFSKIIIVLIHFKSRYLISLKHANDSTGECEVFHVFKIRWVKME